MRTNIVIALDTRYKSKKNLYPVILRISHNGRNTSIKLGYSISENDWDETKRQIKKSHSNAESVARMNNLILKKRLDALNVVTRLEEQGKLTNMPVTELKSHITSIKSPVDFFAFAETLVKEMRQINKIGNARTYQFVIDGLRNFHGSRALPFPQISHTFLSNFEKHLLSRGNSTNSISVYLRTIRVIYNKAILVGNVAEELYPFKRFRIKSATTKKRALSLENLKLIEDLAISENRNLLLTRNLFLFSVYAMGMNFTDICLLKKSHIIDGRIQYRRAKTGQSIDLQLLPVAKQIIEHYSTLEDQQEYVFPIIKRTTPAEIYKDILWARNRYNKQLKELAKKAGIDQTLTSYVSRHTFATLAKNKGVHILDISEMLGHQSIKTTQIYLDSLTSERKDKVHASIFE